MRTCSEEKIRLYTGRGWWSNETLGSLVDAAIKATPNRLALVDPANRAEFTDGAPRRLTWAEFGRYCDELTAKLYAGGIGCDDIVVVQMPNVAELVALYVSLSRLGAIVSPVPVQYGRYELSRIAAELEPVAFIASTRFREHDLLAEHAPALGNVRLFSFGSAAPAGAIALDGEPADPAVHKALDRYVRGLDLSANDIVTICWTSGTTGTPKGVPRSHNLWTSIARCAAGLAELREGDMLLNPFPIVNMAALGGFIFNWPRIHGTLVLHHPMDLAVFLGQVESERVCYTIVPPAALNALLRDEAVLGNLDLDSLRAIGSGSAPLSAWMIETYEERHGIAILNNFGSNEGVGLVSSKRDVPDPARRGELFPRFGVEGYEWSNPIAEQVRTRIVDLETGEEIIEPGRPGELLYAGPTIFDGYWNSPEANARVFSADGYFHTGDMFEIAGTGTDEAFYRFVGRTKDIIIRGGVNISPDELDNLLAGHPMLAEAAVAAYPDPLLGERVGVVIAAVPGTVPTLSDITDFLSAEDLAVFKLPERIVIVDSLPRNALGKVLRSELTSLLEGSPDGRDGGSLK